MASQAQRPSVNGVMPKKQFTPRPVTKRPNAGGAKQTQNNASRPAQQRAAPISNKAQSVAGDGYGGGVASAYSIMASRIANRVAEMAEGITFVERQKPNQQQPQQQQWEAEDKKKPRKLEMRFPASDSSQNVSFSAPFLDNTLQMMLQLQNRMLKTTAELSKSEGVSEKALKEQASQSAELSRIIAMICAEKARQE